MTNPVQTLTKSVTVNDNPFMKPVEWLSLALLAGVILVVLPLMLDGFRLNLVGKYLTYAFVALGLVICWGYAGILSLGQGVFFGLGGYCMAMYLKLEASSVENTKIQSTPGIRTSWTGTRSPPSPVSGSRSRASRSPSCWWWRSRSCSRC